MKAYQNANSENLSIEFSLPEDSKARLELFNVSGQRLAVYEGSVNAFEQHKVEFSLGDVSGSNVIIYRLTTEHRNYYGKAVMLR